MSAWVLAAEGSIPEEFQELFDVYWAIGVGVFALITVLAVGFAFWFRESRHPVADRRHTNVPLEISYVAVLSLVVAFLVYLTYSTMDSGGYAQTRQGGEAQEVDPDALPIDVTASRWNWRFHYPEQGVTVQGTGDEIPTLTVPVDRAVTLRMRSVDVIHAIWIPELRFKQDVFPGFVNTMTIAFDEQGLLRRGGECNQFCGLEHARMDFDIEVLSQARFEAWAAEVGT